MRTLRLISTAAAIVLLGAGAVSAQAIKSDQTPSVPTAQQNAPAEKMTPSGKFDQINAPKSDKQQRADKVAPAGAATKGSSDAKGSADVKSTRTARYGGARYAAGHHGPLYNSYRGHRGYRGCRGFRHSWLP